MRYDRQIALDDIGISGQEKLRNASILIVGMGGLGCPAATYLAGAGIGRLGLLDHDSVSITNLHRQTLYAEADTGKKKVEVAAEKLRALNSEVCLEIYDERLTISNARQLIANYDLIIDGTDNFETKYLINDTCLLEDKAWIYASVYKHEGQCSVFNYNNGPSYRCLFPKIARENISCEITGTLGMLPGIFGMYQAMEAVKIILGTGTILSGKLKLQNLMLQQDQLIEIKKRPEQITMILEKGIQSMATNCVLKDTDQFYLDVRELHEEPLIESKNVLRIPLQQLEERVEEIPKDKEVQVFCQSGIRSLRAKELLENKFHFGNLKNVSGGVQTIING
ncbi:HesA/MoeB/ThiF family protein [Christiangramia sp. OXR-203]|jgi:adenylyltransferase/sulfurtransferase|uniref:HesA/MoeB/ThiF family protein n=1 Tax=Christiangramia sp. OXR-203 TaxID=3100176 RepID=UPI002AC915DE|nr:HesA/MoeB/ThiF family protein [Christiangramia sp. OXR-203]WPY99779.1 HesA/MoeB/ThiF family protein [Christiangramia sp. OXR-203]